jgi:hypothetical protein
MLNATQPPAYAVDGTTLQMTAMTSEEMEQLRLDMVKRAEEELRQPELEKGQWIVRADRLH